MEAIQYSVDRDVAILRMTQPPVNGLGHALRSAIVSGMDKALSDDAVRIIVLTGSGGFFSAGADIAEFGTSAATRSPDLAQVISCLEDSPKPVVAAIAGIAFGGGLELALGAHLRVASSASQVGLPEVKLGLVPGAGGTQRLPRVVNAAVAAMIVTSGEPRGAASLAGIPGQRLFDEIVDDTSEEAVIAAAVRRARAASGGSRPRVRDFSPIPADDLAAAGESVRRRARGQLSPVAGFELVENALRLPFDAGLSAERETFARLVESEQSRALRYAFFAERTARRIPGIDPSVKPHAVARVGIVGAGTMGGGIGMNFLNAGIPVTIMDMSQQALDRGLALVRRNYQAQVDKGKLSREAFHHRMALLKPTLSYTDLADADLIVEAVFEEMEIKQQVFQCLDRVAKPGAVLASNTSTLDINEIAAHTSRPESVLGMHFFSPANVMRLVEVVRADAVDDATLVTAIAVGRRIGKVTVVAGVCDGFIGNRMLNPYGEAARVMIEAGATPLQVDSAIERFGFAMGPFRMNDLAGNDIVAAVRRRRYAENPEAPRDEIADALCELKRFGQKTGAGWYDYDEGSRVPRPSKVVDGLLREYHDRHGTRKRDFQDDEIVQRLVFALVNEGAQLLDEGIALRASDIDVVYLAGYGFPRYRGGPMYYADGVGLPEVVARLREFHGPGWQPAPLLETLARENKHLTS